MNQGFSGRPGRVGGSRHRRPGAVSRPEAWRSAGTATAWSATARPAETTWATGFAWATFVKRMYLSDLCRGEDRLELAFDVSLELGDLLALAVVESETYTNKRWENVAESWSSPAGTHGSAAAGRSIFSVGGRTAKPSSSTRAVRWTIGSIGRWPAKPSPLRRPTRRTIGSIGAAAAGVELGTVENAVSVVVKRLECGRGVADFLGRELAVTIGVEGGHDGWAGGTRAVFALTAARPTTTPAHRPRAVAIRPLWRLRQGQCRGKNAAPSRIPRVILSVFTVSLPERYVRYLRVRLRESRFQRPPPKPRPSGGIVWQPTLRQGED